MKFKIVQSLPGSPEPKEPFEPHMPMVDVVDDMDAFFGEARQIIARDSVQPQKEEESIPIYTLGPEDAIEGRKKVGVITPGKTILLIPAPLPNTKAKREEEMLRSFLPKGKQLQITVIAFNKLQSFVQAEQISQCIPFLNQLLGFAYLGHNVLVFEGHPSGLEVGVRDSDVVFIDSGMLPFLDENWAEVIFGVIKTNALVLLSDREKGKLLRVVKKKTHPGWQIGEPHHEGSYLNLLLTVLAKTHDKHKVAEITSGKTLPDLNGFTDDPEQLEYIELTDFKYDQLDSEKVINLVVNSSEATMLDKLRSSRTLKVNLLDKGGKAKPVSFKVKTTTTKDGDMQLRIQLA